MINTTNTEKAHNSASSSHYIHGKKETWPLQKVPFPHHYFKIGLIDDEYIYTHTHIHESKHVSWIHVRTHE